MSRKMSRRDTVIWGEWVVGAQSEAEGSEVWGRVCMGVGGGWVSIRGLVYCVNEVHLFPWTVAPGVGAEGRQEIFRFQTLSCPLLADLISLSIY